MRAVARALARLDQTGDVPGRQEVVAPFLVVRSTTARPSEPPSGAAGDRGPGDDRPIRGRRR
jgi:hypothetical protein